MVHMAGRARAAQPFGRFEVAPLQLGQLEEPSGRPTDQESIYLGAEVDRYLTTCLDRWIDVWSKRHLSTLIPEVGRL